MKTLFASLLLVAAIRADAQNTIPAADTRIQPNALVRPADQAMRSADQVIRPGDVRIRYDWIKPSHDFYKNVISDTSGKFLYEFMMEDFLNIDSANNRLVFARYRQVPPGSFSTDTSVTDCRLKPIRMYEIHYQRDVSFEMSFGDTLASVRTTRKGVESVKTYPMKSGYFEDNMIEYIFGWLELKKGLVYTLDNFNKDTPTPSNPYTLEYVFDDIWPLNGGYTLSCEVLRFTHGTTTGYIWIDTGKHQVVMIEGNFKGGRYLYRKI